MGSFTHIPMLHHREVRTYTHAMGVQLGGFANCKGYRIVDKKNFATFFCMPGECREHEEIAISSLN